MASPDIIRQVGVFALPETNRTNIAPSSGWIIASLFTSWRAVTTHTGITSNLELDHPNQKIQK